MMNFQPVCINRAYVLQHFSQGYWILVRDKSGIFVSEFVWPPCHTNIRLKAIRLKAILKVIRLKVIRPQGAIGTHDCPIPTYFFLSYICPTFFYFLVDCPTIVLQFRVWMSYKKPQKSYICPTMSYNFISKIL